MNSSLRLGTWLSIGSPAIAELASECGLDWVLLDLEHGCESEAALPGQLRALRGGPTLGIVRVPALLPDLVARVLDWGADGIMLPHVGSREEAEACLQAMRYPPRGRRGVSRTVRAHGYGLRSIGDRPDPVFLPQIEDAAGVRAAPEIAAVPGVTALFVGPADLQHALDHGGEGDGLPDYEGCLDRVSAAAAAAGVQAGLLLREESALAPHLERGFDWIAVHSDLGLLRSAFARLGGEKG